MSLRISNSGSTVDEDEERAWRRLRNNLAIKRRMGIVKINRMDSLAVACDPIQVADEMHTLDE